jgi:hypothetical protein
MHDPKQIEFFAFACVVVPSGDDPEIFRQVPAFGKEPADFSVMHPEGLALEVEQIEAPVGSVAYDTLIGLWISDQKTEAADIVHDACRVRMAYVGSTCPRDLIRQDGRRYRMFPAASQLVGPYSP